MGVKLAEAYVDIVGRDKHLNAALARSRARVATSVKRMSATMTQLGQGFQSVGRSFSLYITAPITLAFGIAAKKAMAFGQAMRNVNVIARESEDQFRRTSDEVLKMSKEMGKSPTDLAQALFMINSASFKGAEGLKVLREAAKAAVAGNTQVATSGRAIVGILNAYGQSADQAGDLADILFKTNEKGLLTFEELASNIGTVSSTAAAAKIPFDQIAAAMATMTRGNISAAVSSTSLNRLLFQLLKPTGALKQLYKENNIESGEWLLRTKGLAGAIKILTQATDGSAEKLANLGFGIRSIKAAISLTRAGGQEYANDLDAIANKTNRAGSAQAAFTEQTKALGFRWNQAKAALATAAIKLGDMLAPALEKVIGFVQSAVKWFSGLSKGTQEWIVTIGLLAAALGPVMIIFGKMITGIGGIIGMMGSATKSAIILRSALGGMAAIGLGAFIGWEIGTAIREMMGLNDEINKAKANLKQAEANAKAGQEAAAEATANTTSELKKQVDEALKGDEKQLRSAIAKWEKMHERLMAFSKSGDDMAKEANRRQRDILNDGMTKAIQIIIDAKKKEAFVRKSETKKILDEVAEEERRASMTVWERKIDDINKQTIERLEQVKGDKQAEIEIIFAGERKIEKMYKDRLRREHEQNIKAAQQEARSLEEKSEQLFKANMERKKKEKQAELERRRASVGFLGIQEVARKATVAGARERFGAPAEIARAAEADKAFEKQFALLREQIQNEKDTADMLSRKLDELIRKDGVSVFG